MLSFFILPFTRLSNFISNRRFEIEDNRASLAPTVPKVCFYRTVTAPYYQIPLHVSPAACIFKHHDSSVLLNHSEPLYDDVLTYQKEQPALGSSLRILPFLTLFDLQPESYNIRQIRSLLDTSRNEHHLGLDSDTTLITILKHQQEQLPPSSAIQPVLGDPA
jgi:hypothetical protein